MNHRICSASWVRVSLVGAATLVAATVWAAPQTVTLAVPGMDCPVCPITVKKALQQVQGVAQVDVSFARREAVVSYDDAAASTSQLTQAIAKAGYTATVASQRR